MPLNSGSFCMHMCLSVCLSVLSAVERSQFAGSTAISPASFLLVFSSVHLRDTLRIYEQMLIIYGI